MPHWQKWMNSGRNQRQRRQILNSKNAPLRMDMDGI
jgi:hypothetical protein